MDYVTPSFNKKSFNCPSCNAYSHQIWAHYYIDENNAELGKISLTTKTNKFVKVKIIDDKEHVEKKDLSIAYCYNCKRDSVWVRELMVSPMLSSAPIATKNMPKDILDIYNEARDVLNISPKSSCALLRLALQRLCKELGGKGKNIDKDIKFLVEKGLPMKIQQALDIIRVIGNESVHPGTIDVDDNPEIAQSLFKLINLVIDTMINEPLEIEKLYEILPENKKEGIKQRDSAK